MPEALMTNKKYEGKYVAFDPEKSEKVLAFGQNAGTVIKKARERGAQTPAILFVPKKNTAYIY